MCFLSSFAVFRSAVSEEKSKSQPIRGLGGHPDFLIDPKNTNSVDNVEILLPVSRSAPVQILKLLTPDIWNAKLRETQIYLYLITELSIFIIELFNSNRELGLSQISLFKK